MIQAQSLEPLADYLQPRFGDIYDYDWSWQGPLLGNKRQEWTNELREAVRHYVIHVADDQLYRQAAGRLEHVADESRPDMVDVIMSRYEPWRIAFAFHEAAVMTLPSLKMLVKHLNSWANEEEREDAACWLRAHATDGQIGALASMVSGLQLTADRQNDPEYIAHALVDALTPRDLLIMWKKAVGA
jgi:hypothetical protein